MKLTTLPDGTVQVEGTPDEVRELLAPAKDAIGKMVPAAAPVPTMQPYAVRAGHGWAHNNACAAQALLSPTAAAANPMTTWFGTWRA